MDELDDDNLRDAFSRLRQYESPKKGVTWESISQHLGNGGFSKAIILSLTLLMVTVPSLLFLNFQNATNSEISSAIEIPKKKSTKILEIDNNGNTTLASSTIKQPSISSSAIVAREAKSFNENLSESKVYSNDTVVTISNASSINDVANEEVIDLESPLEEAELIEIADIQSDLSASDSTLRSDKSKRIFNITLSPFYSFGIVQPISADNEVLKTYKFKPGFGFKADVLINVLSNNRFAIGIGPTYQFTNKYFDYVTSVYQAESVNQVVSKYTVQNHALGLSVQLANYSSGWRVGTTLLASLNKSDHFVDHVGTSTLYLQAIKEIDLKNRGLQLQLGMSAGAPLTGSMLTFKYYPVQLMIGLRREIQVER